MLFLLGYRNQPLYTNWFNLPTVLLLLEVSNPSPFPSHLRHRQLHFVCTLESIQFRKATGLWLLLPFSIRVGPLTIGPNQLGQFFLLAFLIKNIISPTSPTPLRSFPSTTGRGSIQFGPSDSTVSFGSTLLGPVGSVHSSAPFARPTWLDPHGSVNMAQHTLDSLTRLRALFLPRPLGPIVH